ncbi:ferritin-like domain-containing protein [Virgibacillus halodenitrificans]|jgi:bacterioferritin|uniref:Bacterioferritin n=1 Tax=Virgibacillus halodenitrificans TaxID=1482 RepID=A0AAC9J0Q2_VIRHA|nr:ferritin-like domain-containing protein [Virgibacillus halodenitrificans]APC47444.1 bacterioferritin [Virgibacillus halodenitrificans]MBD1221728.1 ferritin-like domain-containing protein [Virgibacillus halodenitrificans]MCG1029486.1 ferritin-like domain-containing protein [Virgibacillus halodenitrificans]MCJ0932263.1 ferritin-like domain-containing protein [Virgibacillus halodenitrificans]MEC2160715.1 ferritin-like domain-containing protein [Virgibacillus halodenitrificans]
MDKDLQELIDGLNEDLAHEYGAAIQYTYSASVVSGLYRSALKPFFEAEINDELGHALYLSEKIKSLGGTPTTKSADVPQPSDVKDLLEATLKAESDTIDRYEKRKKQAENLGYTELVVKLEDLISDETHHKEEVQRLLADPRLSQ